MMIKSTVYALNKMLRYMRCQLVSVRDADHVRMLKKAAQQGSDCNVLEMAIQLERCRLQGRSFNIVQIGANDGTKADPYRQHINKYQMSGVLVEPNPASFLRLTRNYQHQPQLRFENSAIGPTQGQATLYMLKDEQGQSTDLDVFASLSHEDILLSQAHIKKKTTIEKIMVPLITLDELFTKYNLKYVSLLAIDTEGFDYQIIKSINFNTIQPAIIEYEHSHLGLAEETACQELLIQKGYKLMRSVGDDTIAVRMQV